MELNVREKTRCGIGWISFSQAFQRAVQFIVLAILARFLEPRDFGIVSMAAVFTGILMLVNDFGIGKALIHIEILDPILVSSSFWANIAISLGLFSVAYLSAPLVASYYKENAVSSVLKFLALTFPLNGISIVHQHLLMRNFNFKLLSISEMISALVSGIVGVSMAILGFGYWSLVGKQLTNSFLKSTILLCWVGNVIKFEFRWKQLKKIFNFSLNLMCFNISNYLSRSADYLLIGRYLGSEELGYYTLAYRLMMIPLFSITTVVGKSLYPSLSRLQGYLERFQKIVLKACRLIAFVSFPVFIILAISAREFITIMFGQKWVPSIIILQILCFVGLRQSIISFLGNIFLSLGKTRTMMLLGLFGGVINVMAFAIGLNWGIVGVAISYLLSTWIILTYPMVKVPFNMIGLSTRELPRTLFNLCLCSFLMFVSLWFFKYFGITNIKISAELKFIAEVVFGLLSYYLYVKVFARSEYTEFKKSLIPDRFAAFF